MSNFKSVKAQIEPRFYPETSLNKKIPSKPMMGDSNSLLKYFPKYYNDLYLYLENPNGPIQSKIKQLKIVRHIHGSGKRFKSETILKQLFQTSRKTLKSIPRISEMGFSHQNLALCMYFPKVKTLNLDLDEKDNDFSGSTLKQIYGHYGYFWSSSRFVESLEIRCSHYFNCRIMEKIDSSERFLSHLKKVEVVLGGQSCSQIQSSMLEPLLMNQNFLGHVTNLRIERFLEKTFAWKVVQSLIDCCTQLYSLSLPTEKRSWQDQESVSRNFSLDLSRLQNLQALTMEVQHFRTFITGIELPPSVRTIDLKIIDHEESDNFKEAFGIQDCENDETIEDQNARDWKSFERYEILNGFFDKWRKLSKLRILDLKIWAFPKIDTLRSLILPLLRAIPQLEKLYLTVGLKGQITLPADRLFDLKVFFSGIETMKSLKYVTLSTNEYVSCLLSGPEHSQRSFCLPNLSSVKIRTKFDSNFDLKEFLDGFLCLNSLQPELPVMNRTLDLRQSCMFSVQDFIRILNVVHSVSHFKNLQLHLQICLIVESFREISSNFTYPMHVAHNTQLTVNIHLKNFKDLELTLEQKQYFKRIFGQLRFTVNTAAKYNCDRNSLGHVFYNNKVLMRNSTSVHEEKEVQLLGLLPFPQGEF